METAHYYTIIGILLFIMSLTHGLLRKLPITTSVIYLLFGIGVGKDGFDLIPLDPIENSKIIEVIAEITVIVSLFTVGLKLRLPFRDKRWWIPISLASVSMLITICGITAVGFFFFHLSLGESILLGAILSPTDPVLASEVQVSHPKDHDTLKFSLTSEGGMNDGSAFPFVMLGLGLVGVGKKDWSLEHWLMVDLLWAISCGLIIGVITGAIVSYLARYVKEQRQSYYMEDFLTISSIAISYGLAIQLKGYGFLAVFANALMIRQIELRDKGKQDLPDDVLSFNEQLERIFEVISVVTIGVLIDLNSFRISYLIFAIILFCLIRPLSTGIGLIGLKLERSQKLLVAWFGIRGIGSLYYLYFSRNHGLPEESFIHISNIMLWTIVFSVLWHGISVKPIMKRYKNRSRI